MAHETVEKQGVAERTVRFFRDVHIALGAVALGGAVLLQSSFLGAVAGYEAANSVVHEGVRQVVKKPKKSSQK